MAGKGKRRREISKRRIIDAAREISHRSNNAELQPFQYNDGALVHHVEKDLRRFYVVENGKPFHMERTVYALVCGRVLGLELHAAAQSRRLTNCVRCLMGPMAWVIGIDWGNRIAAAMQLPAHILNGGMP